MHARTEIAIVDDDPGVRAALEDLVRSIGYASCGFGSADAYLSDGEPGRFDCLILDIRMPGLSGLELQELLLAEARHPPVIFVSSFVDEAIERRARAAGARCVFAKPVDDQALIDCIEAAVAARA